MKVKLKKDVKPFRIVWGGKEWKIPKIDNIPQELYEEIKNKPKKKAKKSVGRYIKEKKLKQSGNLADILDNKG